MDSREQTSESPRLQLQRVVGRRAFEELFWSADRLQKMSRNRTWKIRPPFRARPGSAEVALPVNERGPCALCFFGLPKCFEDMVLLEILKDRLFKDVPEALKSALFIFIIFQWCLFLIHEIVCSESHFLIKILCRDPVVIEHVFFECPANP